MNAAIQVLPHRDEVETPAVYPGELTPLLQSLLATLADIDFAFETDLQAARAAATEGDLRHRIIERLVTRHREQREPYVRQLSILEGRMRRLIA